MTRIEGAVLVLFYLAYVTMIWVIEKKLPSLGEAEELEEQSAHRSAPLSIEIVLVFAGVAAMAVGSMVLVEGVWRIAPEEPGHATLGLTIVGFATGFELVVLAWSTARPGASEAAIAAVVGSFAYNATMTLGAAALARPLALQDAARTRFPSVLMNAALALVIVLAMRKRQLGAWRDWVCLLLTHCTSRMSF